MKNILKLTTTILLAMLIAIPLAACTQQTATGGSSGKMAHIYKSMKELKDSAVEIVEVEIIENVDNIVYKEVPFTLSKAKVISSLKGELKAGAELKIIETGGNIDGRPLYFDGIPVVQSGENLVLFLKKYDGPVTKDAYLPLGVYMGKFKIEKDKVVQQSIDEYKLKDYSPVDLKEFKEKVRELNRMVTHKLKAATV